MENMHDEHPFGILIKSSLSLLLLLISGAVSAVDDATSATESELQKKPGFYTDSFRILPEVQLTAYHDDNVYASQTDTVSDNVAILTPRVTLKSLWDRHQLGFDTGANIGRYQDNGSEDYEDYWLKADGKYEISSSTGLFAGVGHERKHEGRAEKESVQSADAPTLYTVDGVQAGIRHQLADYAIRFGLTYEQLDFDNVGDLINDDRDRSVSGLGLRVSKPITELTKWFAQGLMNQRKYDDAQDSAGYNRDSSGYTLAIGASHRLAQGGKVEAFVGLLSQEYEDPAFDRVNDVDFGLNLLWYPMQNLKLTAQVQRQLKETTELGASGYLSTGAELQLEKKLSSKLVGYASYGYNLAEYQQSQREDVANSLGLGLKYFMNNRLLLTLGYSLYSNDSNDQSTSLLPGESYDFDKNLFMLTAKLKLAP